MGAFQGERPSSKERTQCPSSQPRSQISHRPPVKKDPPRETEVKKKKLSTFRHLMFSGFVVSNRVCSVSCPLIRKLIEDIDEYDGDDPLSPWIQ